MKRNVLVPLVGALAMATTTLVGTAIATTSVASAASTAGSKITACLMIEGTTVDDHGFNQEAWGALQQAATNYGVKTKYLLESGSVSWATIGSEFVQEGCNFIVGEGFDTETEIDTLAKANPTLKFALIDDDLTTPEPNATSLFYKTQQAAFLAGYLSAGYSKAKVVGELGNEPVPPVLDYLDGFYTGVEYYNKVNHASVKIIGWNATKKTGEFMGSFTDENKSQTIASQELNQGADIVYSVGGQQGTAAAIQQAGGPKAGVSEVWVDQDGCGPYPSDCADLLTSVEKNITPSLYAVLKSDVLGTFKGSGEYLGTLADDGVGLAGYHDFASKIPASLQAQVKALIPKIKSGAINPDPYDKV
jgi:basic membrane protein A and related proteins